MSQLDTQSKVITDIKNNRLYITLKGTITKTMIDAVYTDIRFGVADLQPGFAVITDLSGARFGHLSGIPSFFNITRYLHDHEVGTVVRITRTRSVISRQIARLSELIQGYKPKYVSSRKEAEELLAREAQQATGSDP